MLTRISLLLFFVAFPSIAQSQWQLRDSSTTAEFRGLSVVSRDVIWASGSQDTFARTIDGGATWRSAIVPGGGKLDFRDVEALIPIPRTSEHRPRGTFTNLQDKRRWLALDAAIQKRESKAFFAVLGFWDCNHAIALSDPR